MAAARAFPGVPLLFNWAEGGKTPPVSLERLRQLGYRIVIFPISTLLAATAAMRRVLREIAQAGTPAAILPELPGFGEFCDFIGLPEVREAEQRYAATDPPPQPSRLTPPGRPPRRHPRPGRPRARHCRGARQRRETAPRRHHGHEGGVPGEDLQLQPEQARAGRPGRLSGRHRAGLSEPGQRLGPPARPVQRHHELAQEPLALRMLPDEAGKQRHRLVVAGPAPASPRPAPPGRPAGARPGAPARPRPTGRAPRAAADRGTWPRPRPGPAPRNAAARQHTSPGRWPGRRRAARRPCRWHRARAGNRDGRPASAGPSRTGPASAEPAGTAPPVPHPSSTRRSPVTCAATRLDARRADGPAARPRAISLAATGRPPRIASMASTARRCGDPMRSSWPPRQARTGPSS